MGKSALCVVRWIIILNILILNSKLGHNLSFLGFDTETTTTYLTTMDLRVLVFALSVFLVFDCGEGLRCHICNGREEAKCDDPFGHSSDNGTLIHHSDFKYDCDTREAREKQGIPENAPAATMCQKNYTGAGDAGVSRGCGWEGYNYGPFFGEGPPIGECIYYNRKYMCTCMQDFCNGAKINQVSAMLIAVLTLITLRMFHQ